MTTSCRPLDSLNSLTRREIIAARDLAVGFLGKLARIGRLDVAGDHHHRGVGTVEVAIEADGVVAGQLLHLVPPADHRLAVRVIKEQRGVDLLAEPRARIVGDTLVLFLKDHVALRQHHLVGEHKAGHAVGFQFHNCLELLARHALEIAGVVARGEGVFLTADMRDHLREFTRRVLRRALEHQMLEEMRQARFSRRLVGGADLVPDHVGDNRRAVIGNDDQLQSVREREVGDLGAGLLSAERGRGQCGGENRDGG
jgi:hypothetical protein